jgi:hypothetical protein
MTPKSGLFKARFFGPLLHSTGLALALVVLASPARAESVTLSCRVDTASEAITLRIDYATGLVEQIGPSGQAFTNRTAPNARISANAIVWSATSTCKKFRPTPLWSN